jgi:tRNA G10  N-methylase Trm11
VPKSEEQIFLDRLGGCIRLAEVLGEFREKAKLVDLIYDHVKAEQAEGKPKVGVSSWGTGKGFLPGFLSMLHSKFGELRTENVSGENMSSGQVFDRKLVKKGFEFLIWQNGDSFLLARTRAVQNLRNYTLRDRGKSFRDAEMGMLPPKLAQQLINFASPKKNEIIVDPFCGSGTICSEVAIAGWKTVGSDMLAERVTGTKENFAFLAEKFRYPEESGEFFTRDATKFPWGKYQNSVMATEGFLGTNFTKQPNRVQSEEQSREVLEMWEKFWENTKQAGPRRIACCLPRWHVLSGDIDIVKKFLASAAKVGYTPLALFDNKFSCVYDRPGAYVAREILVLERRK